jgi:glycosyltransferase involved in cell wall biosynthesis
MTIHVIVPTYNCMPFLPTCLGSLASQTYPDFDVVVIDDASTDPRQAPYIERFCAERAEHGWRAILNGDTNLEAAQNIWHAHRFLDPDPDDIIVELDGDDWLAHDQVLAHIAEAYENPAVWLTYGSYEYWPNPDHWVNPALPYPPKVIADRSYRTAPVLFNHPETWRAFMWERLNEWELKDDAGRWIRRTWDYAAMMPLLELAGPHWRHLPEVLYTYNHSNQLSHVRNEDHAEQAIYEANSVKHRPPRDPIPDTHIDNPRRKRDMLIRLRDRYDLGTLVETGTGVGDLTHWCWRYFRQVLTVEMDDQSYAAVAQRFARHRDRVEYFHSDSVTFLRSALASFERRPVLFFLDAHYSGPGTARGTLDSPLSEELGLILASNPNHVVVVDDARLCTNPEGYTGYPPLATLRQQVAAIDRRMTVEADMIIIEPEGTA